MRAVDGDMEQGDEIALHVLDQIIDGAGLQRGDGDRGILRRRDEHHRRRIRDRQNPLQRLEAVEAGHVLIERDDVDAALLQPLEPLRAAGRMHDLEAEPRQAALDQPGQRRVVVDIKQRGRGRGHVAAGGNLNDGEEQSELANGVGEAFVVHRLGDVDVAAEFVAALDLLGVVGGGEHHDRRAFEMGVFLDPPQDVDAGHVGQIEVEQDQQRLALVREAAAVAAEQVVHRICTVGERHDLVVDAGTADIALDQAGVSLVVLDHDDGDWIAHEFSVPVGGCPADGQRDGEGAAVVEFRRHRHGSPEPPHQGPDMGEPDALARLVLGAGAAKQVENPLMILGIDAAAVVGDLENRKAELCPAPDRDLAGNSRLEVFQRVVDQVGENLFHREAVADDVGQRFDADLRPRPRRPDAPRC